MDTTDGRSPREGQWAGSGLQYILSSLDHRRGGPGEAQGLDGAGLGSLHGDKWRSLLFFILLPSEG